MIILFDLGHPAHVHYFKNVIRILQNKGHIIFITARKKDVTHDLLKSYDLPFIDRGKGSDTLIGKVSYVIKTDLSLYNHFKSDKPDLLVGFGSPYVSHTAFLLGRPSIIIDDTENAKFGHLLYRPPATTILSPDTFKLNFGSKHIKFNGFMELAYLRKEYFEPDHIIREKLLVKPNEKYCILRFVSWTANHHLGHNGISLQNKLRMVQEFSKYSKVFISSEANLPAELEKYRFNIEPSYMHQALYYANLVFGESATMASEAAVVGTYAIYLTM